MILSDSEIIKRLESWNIVIESTTWKYDDRQVWPASLDFNYEMFLRHIKGIIWL